MAIISTIGNKTLKVRLLYLFIYAFLIIGSASMVYPFMLMVSGSTKSAVDIKYFDAFPKFVYDLTWLYRKHAEGVLNEKVATMNYAYNCDTVSYEYLNVPAHNNRPLVEEMKEYVKGAHLPFYAYTAGYVYTPYSGTIPLNLRRFKEFLQQKYGADITQVNQQLDTEFTSWATFKIEAEQYLYRREKPIRNPFFMALAEFKAGAPIGLCYFFSPTGFFKKEYLYPVYGRDVEAYNKQNGTHYSSYDEIFLTRDFPSKGAKKQKSDWEYFVRNTLALHFLKIDKSVTPLYHDFLKNKHGDIATLNKNYGSNYKTFVEIPFMATSPEEGMMLSDWEALIMGWKDPDTKKMYQVPIEAIHIDSAEFQFQDFLKKKYKTLVELNQKLGTDFKSFNEILLPQRALHYNYLLDNRWSLTGEFITRNFKCVAEYMLFHGRGIFNTVVYCMLQILCALTINPIAAYAMSRYKMPSTYKILLFLLCTMAFPPMVTSIPNFLMLRQLGLLNTFAALILPGMANGYAIFLLKGFFDSQPKELYECAQLDGANEWTLFWNIAMSLSKPILAVIALEAFTLAYSNFMFAFVVCQDRKMWTLMVWLYQLQQESGQAVMYASLLIAAVPTFLIFLFCQNIIMRGIVVPSEK